MMSAPRRDAADPRHRRSSGSLPVLMAALVLVLPAPAGASGAAAAAGPPTSEASSAPAGDVAAGTGGDGGDPPTEAGQPPVADPSDGDAPTGPVEVTEPDEPAAEAAEPAQDPAEPAEPAQDPAEPAEPAQDPAEQPAEPAQDPAEQPAEPAQEPAEPAQEPAEPVAPAEPAEQPAEPVAPAAPGAPGTTEEPLLVEGPVTADATATPGAPTEASPVPTTGVPLEPTPAPPEASAPATVPPSSPPTSTALLGPTTFEPDLQLGAGRRRAPGGFPADLRARMDSVVRSGSSSTAALAAAADALEASGLERDDAIRTAFGRFPVGGAATYSHDWWFPRYGPGWRLHQGTDIFAAHGTPVLATVDGVASIRNSGLGGLSVRITEADGTFWYLAHLSAVRDGLVAGAAVQAGDVVGYVGNTGNARTTPPHLHLEIHPGGGSAVDPKATLDRLIAEAQAALPADLSVAVPGALPPATPPAATVTNPPLLLAVSPVADAAATTPPPSGSGARRRGPAGPPAPLLVATAPLAVMPTSPEHRGTSPVRSGLPAGSDRGGTVLLAVALAAVGGRLAVRRPVQR